MLPTLVMPTALAGRWATPGIRKEPEQVLADAPVTRYDLSMRIVVTCDSDQQCDELAEAIVNHSGERTTQLSRRGRMVGQQTARNRDGGAGQLHRQASWPAGSEGRDASSLLRSE
jgi:hypothetical protein